MLATALAAALLTGLVHAGIVLVDKYLLTRVVHFSREFVWMAPLSYALVFLLAAIPLVALQLVVRPLRDFRVVVGWFVLFGVFGILLNYQGVARVASLALSLGAAVQMGRLAGARLDAWRRGVRRLALGLSAAVAAIAAGQVGIRALGERRALAGLPELTSADAPNVLVIILDTVRAATLSLHGAPLETTPALARWATDGATFDWAFSPAPWTLPSHASMFTGRTAGELVANWTVPHDRTTPVLAEAFRDRGYRTAGFVGNLDYTSWDSGLDRGFAHYEDYHVSFRQLWLSSSYTQTATVANALKARSVGEALRALLSGDLSINPKHRQHPRRADAVTNGFLRWQASSGDRPFFAFLNYFDAHAAYYSPPGSPVIGTPGTAMSEYASAIRWLDTNLDSLFRALQTRGALDNTVVIVTSDHGELFNEHGLFGHAHNLYRNVLHVPLVIRFPRRVPAGIRVNGQASLRHLAATVADLAGLPAGSFPGTSLRDMWERPEGTAGPVLAEVRQAPNVEPHLPTATGDLAALLDDSLHYIVSTAGREEVFRYRVDTAEAVDLARGADSLALLRDRRDLLQRMRSDPRQTVRR